MSKYARYNRTTQESTASLYRAQNNSVLGCLVALVAVAVIALAIIVIFAL